MGLFHGLIEEYNNHNIVTSTVEYVSGKMDGKHESYSYNGTKRWLSSVYHYTDNEQHGKIIAYDETGTVTDDDNALSLFFTPKGVISTDADGASELDVIVLACAQYGRKVVMQNLTAAMAAPYSGKFITLFDGYADKPAIDPTTDIVGVTGSTVIHAHQ